MNSLPGVKRISGKCTDFILCSCPYILYTHMGGAAWSRCWNTNVRLCCYLFLFYVFTIPLLFSPLLASSLLFPCWLFLLFYYIIFSFLGGLSKLWHTLWHINPQRCATEALSACLRLIMDRESRLRIRWYYNIYETAQEALRAGSQSSHDSIHGRLLFFYLYISLVLVMRSSVSERKVISKKY